MRQKKAPGNDELRKKQQNERKRRQRQKIKSDPILNEEMKKKERERYHRRVAEGSLKLVNDMTKKAHQRRQQQWRNVTSKYRRKKTSVIDPPSKLLR